METQKKEGGRGKKSGSRVVRSFSMRQGLVDKVDMIAAQIKRKTGIHVDRSKILSALCELLVESQDMLSTLGIEDEQSLKEKIADAIAQAGKPRKPARGNGIDRLNGARSEARSARRV